MTAWLLLLALPLAGAVLATAGGLWWRQRMPRLTDVPDAMPEGRPWPRLSVIAPCRDEGAAVERAARSLLAQDYPELEVVFVDDRSTDDTGAILDRLRDGDARLVVVHVAELPDSWLGKTHACQRGAERASGDWLLFTDGDVVFEPGALRRAVAFAEARGLGHFVALPHFDAPGFLERAFVATFGVAAILKFRLWELARAGTRAHIGVGAFNLVRASDYRRVGGHAAVAYEVVDDVKLGLVLRRSGVPQGAIDSGGLVHLRWHAGAHATMRGLVKNIFAAVEYRWPVALFGAALCFVAVTVPFAALALTDGVPFWIAAVTVALNVFLHAGCARDAAGGSGLEGLAYPLTQACLGAVLLVSAWQAESLHGIAWRGTFYPLGALRARCVRERDWPASKAVGWP